MLVQKNVKGENEMKEQRRDFVNVGRLQKHM